MSTLQSNQNQTLQSITYADTKTSFVHNMVTGYYNGFCVEVLSEEEMSFLYLMGCFGKGTFSRSKPKLEANKISLMRERQFNKRNDWHNKFGKLVGKDSFLNDAEELMAKIKADMRKNSAKDVIDLVSSDEEYTSQGSVLEPQNVSSISGDGDIVVVVPNSDSEGEDYFHNFTPKSCINKTSLKEKLVLTLEETFFLMYAVGCLQLADLNNTHLNVQQAWDLFMETDKKFLNKYLVYHYFKSKGYVVKPGIKFGGDFLLYRDSPGIHHADYIVIIRHNLENNKLSWTELLGQIRMAATTVKEILLVEVKIKNQNIKPQLPQDLANFNVTETKLSRNIPITTTCND